MTKKEIEYCTDERGCHICTSHHLSDGYPTFNREGEQRISRFILKEKLGRDIQEGCQALHLCNNRACINPEHLYEGTCWNNIVDSVNAGTHHNFEKGNKCAKNFRKGEDCGSAKLTNTEAEEIFLSPLPCKELSIKYNISKSHVWAIKNGSRRLFIGGI